MSLEDKGDAAVADGIKRRPDILAGREVPAGSLRQGTEPLQLKRGQSGRAKGAPPAPLRLFFSEEDDRHTGTRVVPTATDPVPSILRCAETLDIPWQQIVVDEIDAEQKLRRFIADVEKDYPLRSALKLLPSSFLRSWRIRRQIESLSLDARSASTRDAIRQLRAVFSELVGGNESEKAALALHLWFAYQRILLLQRVRRAAWRSRGEASQRLATICSAARCSYDDAAWALLQEESPRRGNRLDAAVRKVREEGFRIPQATTEARAFAQLRRIVRSSPPLSVRRRPRGILGDPDLASTSTKRVPVPPDAV